MILCTIPDMSISQKNKLNTIGKTDVYFSEDVSLEKIPYDQISVLLTFGYDLNEETLAKLTNVKWIHIFQTGIEHISIKPILDRGIRLSHTRDIHGIPISEYVLSMILYSVRDIPRFIANKDAKLWDKGELLVEEANGKTVTIFGTGSIGVDIAKLLKALDMHVIGVNTTGRSVAHFDEVYAMKEKANVFPKSDFIVLILPATKDTYHCIGEAELNSMKNNSFLINVGRGSLINTQALQASLLTNKIKGAALDVFDEEPLPKNDPLWDMPNLFISPHNASFTNKYLARCIAVFEGNFALYEKESPLKYEINKGVEY